MTCAETAESIQSGHSINVHAVVVTFNPDRDVLLCELELVAPQVEKIWLVDNGSEQNLLDWVRSLGLKNKLELVQMPSNLGLGAAQNAATASAFSAGAKHVLMLDQDSQPSPSMVQHLLAACQHLQAMNMAVAVVAPVYADSANGQESGFVRFGWLDFKKQKLDVQDGFIEADFVISSGSLIPKIAFEQVGAMDEMLFIDHVDTEWCLRAQSKGFRLFGVLAAKMVHSLGDKRKRIWFLRWRNVSFHSPFRYYYILRNSILLQRRGYIPLKWRVVVFLRSVRVVCFYGVFSSNRVRCLQFMLKGIWHGLRGVSGPYKA